LILGAACTLLMVCLTNEKKHSPVTHNMQQYRSKIILHKIIFETNKMLL